MVKNRCLGPPVQHAGLERLYLSREVVSFGNEAVDRVVGRGQVNGLGHVDQPDQQADEDDSDKGANRLRTAARA